MTVKEFVCTAAGVVGAAVSSVFGGWNAALTTLVIFMIIDYITGTMVAAVWKRSAKSENGGLSSASGLRGLCRKATVLASVLVAARLDLITGSAYIRDAACIGFILNETLSIIENAGLMGVPLPGVIRDAVDVLGKAKDKGENK